MQDSVVLTHCKAVIKGLMSPTIAISLIELNAFAC